MKNKVTKTEVYTVTNNSGEVVEEHNHQTFMIEREPYYVKLYIEDIGRLNGISTTQNKILLSFIRSMGYSNLIPTYKPIKMMIAKELNVSLNTINMAVSDFKKKGLFIPVARGMYIADPNLFGKGKWSDIKSLRLSIEYKKDGTKKLSSDLPEQLKLNLGI